MFFKFSNNITLLESFLKQNNIAYEEEDLEDTPLGRGYVLRRDKTGCGATREPVP